MSRAREQTFLQRGPTWSTDICETIPTQLVRELWIQTTRRHYLPPVPFPGMTTREATNTECWWGWKEGGTIAYCWRAAGGCGPLWEQCAGSWKKLIELVIPLLGMCLKKSKIIHRAVPPPQFTATSLRTADTGKRPLCPSQMVHPWWEEAPYIHNGLSPGHSKMKYCHLRRHERTWRVLC